MLRVTIAETTFTFNEATGQWQAAEGKLPITARLLTALWYDCFMSVQEGGYEPAPLSRTIEMMGACGFDVQGKLDTPEKPLPRGAVL